MRPFIFDMRDSFVFMKQWREGLKTLSPTEQAEAFNAIVDYALEGKPYAGNNAAIKMFMALITAQIDEHNAKYSEVCEKRANAARRRWEDVNASKSIQKDANASKSSDLHPDNDNDCDSDCDNDCVSNKLDIKKTTPKGDSKKKSSFDFRRELIETYQVPDYVVDTWLEIRKKKKANNSKLALDALVREAGKAGISVAEAVRKAAENSWQSFQACYIKDRAGYNRNNPLPTSASFDEAERSRLEAEIAKQKAEVAKVQAEKEKREQEEAERERIRRLNELTGFEYQPNEQQE